MNSRYSGFLLRSERLLLAFVAVGFAILSMGIGASTSAQSQSYDIRKVEILRVPGPAIEIPAIPAAISVKSAMGNELLASLLAEHRCLAEVMYYEARGEGEEGEKAVAEVVFHRVAEGDHGQTICSVVYEGAKRAACQFSFACNGARDVRKSPEAWQDAQVLAARIFAGEERLRDETSGATYYHATYVRPYWAPHLVRTAQIGNHVFYRARTQAITIADNSFRGSMW